MLVYALHDGGIDPDIGDAGSTIVFDDHISLDASTRDPESNSKKIEERALTGCKLPWIIPIECRPANPQAKSMT